MKKQEIDKEYYYDLQLILKLSPKKWNIIPYINRPIPDVCIFHFEWLFFEVELQKWTDHSFSGDENIEKLDNLLKS